MSDTIYRCRRCLEIEDIAEPTVVGYHCLDGNPKHDWQEGVFVPRETLSALLIDPRPLTADQLARLRQAVGLND